MIGRWKGKMGLEVSEERGMRREREDRGEGGRNQYEAEPPGQEKLQLAKCLIAQE